MSKTYRKSIRVFNCCGTNTYYYDQKRRLLRRLVKHEVYNATVHYDWEDMDEGILPVKFIMPDRWRETTDGHFLLDKETLKKLDPNCRYGGYAVWCHSDFDPSQFNFAHFCHHIGDSALKSKNRSRDFRKRRKTKQLLHSYRTACKSETM